MAKNPNFVIMGVVFSHSAPINVIFGTGHRSTAMYQISCLSGQCVAPVGQKHIFGPLSKNAIPAWVHCVQSCR